MTTRTTAAPAAPAPAGRCSFAVVDVETTGLDPETDRVVQVAVVLLDAAARPQRTWSTLVDPRRDPGPVHVHGLTADVLRGAPVFADVAADLARLLAGRVLVAHHARFDWGFLAAEFRRAGVPFGVRRRLCTRVLSEHLGLPVPDRRLASLAAHCGVRQLRPHDAVDDARVAVEVLRHCLRAAHERGVGLPVEDCAP